VRAVAVIIGIFFVIGFFNGAVGMLALAAARKTRSDRLNRAASSRYWPGPSRHQAEPDDGEPADPPWWQARDGE